MAKTAAEKAAAEKAAEEREPWRYFHAETGERIKFAHYDELEKECKTAKAGNKDLRKRSKVAESAKETLEENISKLYNTAKAQITRLQQQVSELQQQR